jgi:hypothetical protein
MSRSLIHSMTAVAFAFAAAGTPALAQSSPADCSKMVTRIADEAGNRFDDASNTAKAKLGELAKLCKDGKAAEADKLGKELMGKLGLK